MGYHIYDIENMITMKQQTRYKEKEEMLADYEELKEEYNEEYGLEKSPALKGILEGKNVIILQLESVQEYVINKELNGQEITPNLNKFINENIEFSNMNMQSYSTTADSEFSTISSLYPMENGMSFANIIQIHITQYLIISIMQVMTHHICMEIMHISGIEEMYIQE